MRFAFFTKRFDVQNANGQTIMEVASAFYKLWTFPFKYNEKTVACVSKKWSGLLSEVFTDLDNFLVELETSNENSSHIRQLNHDQRCLVLAASIFIDLCYFENKAGR